MFEITLGEFTLLKNIVLCLGITSFLLVLLLFFRFKKCNKMAKEIWLYVPFQATEKIKEEMKRELYFKMEKLTFYSILFIILFVLIFTAFFVFLEFFAGVQGSI